MNNKKLPQVYRLDLENSFIRKFEKSSLYQSLRSSQISRVRLSQQKQPRYSINETLKQLSEFNELKSKHKKIKYFPRGRSSESLIDGFNNKKMQQMFLLLPFHCSSYLKRKQCQLLWKRLVLGVEVILFYKKLCLEQMITKTASCPLIPPRRSSLKSLNYPASPPKRKLRSRTQGEGGRQTPSGFGDYVKAMYESEKQKKELTVKYSVAREFRNNDSRIKRLMTSKIQDFTLDLSRNRCGSIRDPSALLPPLTQPYKDENNRIKRVSSTLIRRIRTLRQY